MLKKYILLQYKSYKITNEYIFSFSIDHKTNKVEYENITKCCILATINKRKKYVLDKIRVSSSLVWSRVSIQTLGIMR